MNYWLIKSEPDEFSFQKLANIRKEPWTGVRNYQARNFMRIAKVGDPILFYHSSCEEPGVVGIAKVSCECFADPTQFNPKSAYYDPKSALAKPRWSCFEVEYDREFKRMVSLANIRQCPALQGMIILRQGNRLSVTPVTNIEFKTIVALGGN